MTAISTYISSQKNCPTRLLAKRQLEFVDEHIRGDVLDVGCGDGIIGAIYGDRVTSCDIEDNNRFGIEVDIARGEELPYDDNSFDTVCLIGVIEHTENPMQVMIECCRVLKDSGRLIMTYPNGWGWWFLKRLIPREGVILHADFRISDIVKPFRAAYRKTIIPGFFVGEVYE